MAKKVKVDIERVRVAGAAAAIVNKFVFNTTQNNINGKTYLYALVYAKYDLIFLASTKTVFFLLIHLGNKMLNVC